MLKWHSTYNTCAHSCAAHSPDHGHVSESCRVFHSVVQCKRRTSEDQLVLSVLDKYLFHSPVLGISCMLQDTGWESLTTRHP